MSIKDLFTKKSISVSPIERDATSYSEVESIDYVQELEKTKNKYQPPVNFENPEEFAKYGSAEKYYRDSFEYISKSYPYDGSFAEKQKWYNENNSLTNYIFDNLYPRNNGYVNIGYQYGTLLGDSDGYYQTSTEEYIAFNGTLNVGNKYDPTNNREINLKLNGVSGSTVEFYLKKENLSGSDKQVIFDLWNSGSEGSQTYGRFKIEIHPGIGGQEDKFYVDISSGSSGVVQAEIGSGLDFTNWKHYAVAFINSGSQIKLQLFVNGNLEQQVLTGSSISSINGSLKCHLGSLVTAASGTLSDKGWGKLSGSLDEFRYWKVKRTDKEIFRNYFTDIGGGTNTDISNTDLGIYFKFNEGVYSSNSVSSYDKIVLDYSGRISNANWVGYTIGSRNTGSAIVLSGNSFKEFKDPIVYKNHPELLSIIEEYASIGYEYDVRNNGSIYNTLPSWKIEEDQVSGKSTQELFQIISEVLDELSLNIKFLPNIKNVEYNLQNTTQVNLKLLNDVGFDISDIFTDVTMLENFFSRNETEIFEQELYKIKNSIYSNLYNNILNIYKSKGTQKSFRNLLHCFGIDESILNINLYSDNVEYELKDRIKNSLLRKTTVNFNNTYSFDSVIYQKQDITNPNSLGYLTDSQEISIFGSTIEANIIIPKKLTTENENYFETNFLTSSIFGTHATDGVNWSSPDNGDLQVYVIKQALNSSNVKFKLTSSCLGIDLETGTIEEIYEDTVWNISVRIKPETYPLTQIVSGTVIEQHQIEFYGVSYSQDIMENSFSLETTVTSSLIDSYYSSNKAVYGGAHRQNFTGSVLQYSDIELINISHWNSYLDTETLNKHCLDLTSYGSNTKDFEKVLQQFKLLNSSSVADQFITQNDTISFRWDYLQNIENDSNLIVNDASSGSLEMLYSNAFSQNTEYQFTGKLYTENPNTSQLFKNRYLNTSKIQLPESLNSEDLIDIVSEYTNSFEKNERPVNHYFMLEKNMYSIISKEMISWIGGSSKLNNLIGSPLDRYSREYKTLSQYRNKFFQEIENEPDLEKFIEFYKWVDESISMMVEQLIPASMNYSPGVFNVVESHAFERNKYQHKLPTVEFTNEPPTTQIKGINEMLYSWDRGHAPLNGQQNTNCLWWSDRAEIINELNEDRREIVEVILSSNNRKFTKLYNFSSKLIISSFLIKKRTPDIIINRVSFDLSNTSPVEINDLIFESEDCED